MPERIERFARQVERHFGGSPARCARYPLVLRAEAMAMVRQCLDRGEGLAAVSRQLGVGPATLKR